MKQEVEQRYNMITYFSLCCHMRDFIEANVEKKRFNYNKVKMLTNQLAKELEKSIDIIFNVQGIENDDKTAMLDEFMRGTAQMETFFRIGLKMQDLSHEDQVALSEKIEKIHAEYGI
jgi:hypothetical protein